MLEQIINYSIRHKLIVLLFTLGIVGFGLYALSQISIGAVPDVTNNQVQVITTSRNLSTQDVEQFITDQQSIDEWFEAETKGLTDVAKVELKKRWGTMQKVLGSKSRLEKIVFDIVKDFKIKPRLSTGEGNAMLVSGSVHAACKYYELFQNAGFKNCAIITSYQPHHGDIKGEEKGEDNPTDKLLECDV